jgi:hypothetical protein
MSKPIENVTLKKASKGKQKPLPIEEFDRATKEKDEEQVEKHKETKKEIEELKKQIVTEKSHNNTNRIGFLGAMVAGTVGANFLILQGSSNKTDIFLKYGLAIGACVGAYFVNKHFAKRGTTYKQMLKKANEWSKGEFSPEEVKTFKELHDLVTAELKYPEKMYQARNDFNNWASTTAIGIITAASIISGADKALKALDNEKEIDFDLPEPIEALELTPSAPLRFPDP